MQPALHLCTAAQLPSMLRGWKCYCVIRDTNLNTNIRRDFKSQLVFFWNDAVSLGYIVLLMQNSDKICKPFDLQQKFADKSVQQRDRINPWWRMKKIRRDHQQNSQFIRFVEYTRRVEVVNFIPLLRSLDHLVDSMLFIQRIAHVIQIRGFSNDFTTNFEVVIAWLRMIKIRWRQHSRIYKK
jgi:hypothetical protein